MGLKLHACYARISRINRFSAVEVVAKYQTFDDQNAKVEIVDLFHFLISLAQVMGMTPEDVYQAYVKK